MIHDIFLDKKLGRNQRYNFIETMSFWYHGCLVLGLLLILLPCSNHQRCFECSDILLANLPLTGRILVSSKFRTY